MKCPRRDASDQNRGLRTYTPGSTYVKGILRGRLKRWGQRGKKRVKSLKEECSIASNVAKMLRKIKVNCPWI